MTVAYDIVVIGGGNAALCAAITAAEAGARVLILETAPKPYRGGNSRHTRNFRCMHHGPLGPLVESYTEDEYLADLMKVTGGKRMSTSPASPSVPLRNACLGWKNMACGFSLRSLAPYPLRVPTPSFAAVVRAS